MIFEIEEDDELVKKLCEEYDLVEFDLDIMRFFIDVFCFCMEEFFLDCLNVGDFYEMIFLWIKSNFFIGIFIFL